eukprot:15465275-Alexandrium_andersonii.AAC.1
MSTCWPWTAGNASRQLRGSFPANLAPSPYRTRGIACFLPARNAQDKVVVQLGASTGQVSRPKLLRRVIVGRRLGQGR